MSISGKSSCARSIHLFQILLRYSNTITECLVKMEKTAYDSEIQIYR